MVRRASRRGRARGRRCRGRCRGRAPPRPRRRRAAPPACGAARRARRSRRGSPLGPCLQSVPGFRPPARLASGASCTRACRSPPTSSPPPRGWPRSWAARTCSPRCSCGAGWGSRRRRARSWPPASAHPLGAWPGLATTAWRVLEHVERGSRITVHGDYDVDGVCSTAILVRALRTLGADVDWYLPSRIDDGYGLARATVEKLAARGTQPADHGRLRGHRGRGGRARARARDGRRGHRPPLAARGRRAAGRAARAPARQRLPVRGPVRRGRRAQARAGAAGGRGGGPGAGRRGPRPGRARDGGRRRAAAGREPPARARRAARRWPARARSACGR